VLKGRGLRPQETFQSQSLVDPGIDITSYTALHSMNALKYFCNNDLFHGSAMPTGKHQPNQKHAFHGTIRPHPPKTLKPSVVSTMTAAKASLNVFSSSRVNPRAWLCPSVPAIDTSTVRHLLATRDMRKGKTKREACEGNGRVDSPRGGS